MVVMLGSLPVVAHDMSSGLHADSVDTCDV